MKTKNNKTTKKSSKEDNFFHRQWKKYKTWDEEINPEVGYAIYKHSLSAFKWFFYLITPVLGVTLASFAVSANTIDGSLDFSGQISSALVLALMIPYGVIFLTVSFLTLYFAKFNVDYNIDKFNGKMNVKTEKSNVNEATTKMSSDKTRKSDSGKTKIKNKS